MQVFYTVRPGDTLNKIASRWSIPANTLAAANNIVSPFTIYPGQQLSMPPGVTTYVVKPSDSVYSISQKYGLPLNVIVQANGLDYPYLINPGQVLSIPAGVPFYVVRPGDTLYKIAAKYNVTVNGQPSPDLIIAANTGLTPNIYPGIVLAIPYPPPGGAGTLAVVLFDSLDYYLGLYNPADGKLNSFKTNVLNETSNLYWSPDQAHIAAVDDKGIVSIIEVSTRKVIRIDQTSLPAFVDWSPDSKQVIYTNGKVIRAYNISSNTFKSFNRTNALYIQWFPSGTELLYESKDSAGISQLYRSNADGSNERQITRNSGSNYNHVRLSPNGRYVLYTTPGASISEIYILELSTGNLSKIPSGPEAKNYYPTWSPDSTKIAYCSTFYMNGKYYSQIRAAGFKGENDTILAISSCYSTPVTWSPDSRKIAYLSGCRDVFSPVEVWSIDIMKPVPMNIMSGFTFYYLDWSSAR